MKTNHIHRGEIVEKTIRSKGINITKLAEEIGVSKPTIYNQLERADMNTSYILKIGEVLNVDFSKFIPGLDGDMPHEYASDIAIPAYKKPAEPLEIVIRLDGTDRTLSELVQRLTRLNAVISV